MDKENFVVCGRCHQPVPFIDAELCWFCHRPLCEKCWDEYGHCGHPEAEEMNKKAREVNQPMSPDQATIARDIENTKKEYKAYLDLVKGLNALCQLPETSPVETRMHRFKIAEYMDKAAACAKLLKDLSKENPR